MFLLSAEYESEFDNHVVHAPPPFPKGVWQSTYDKGLKYFENFNGFDYKDYTILEVEKKFSIKLCGYEFVGLADLILRNNETGGIEVIDHKSKGKASMNKELDLYRRQLYLYAMYVKEAYGEYPTRLRFNMFKEGYWIDEDFDELALNETILWAMNIIHEMENDDTWAVHITPFFCRNICGCFDYCPAQSAIIEASMSKKRREELASI